MDSSPDSQRYQLNAINNRQEGCQHAPSGRNDQDDELRNNFQSS